MNQFEPKSGPASPAEARPVYVPYALRLMAAWSWRGILAVIAAGLLIKGLSAVTIVFIPVLVSLLVAALLSPAVDVLEKHRWRRGLASGAVFVAAIIVVVGLIGLTGQQIATGFASLSDQAVAGYKSVIDSLKSGGVSSRQLSHWMDEALARGKHAVENNSDQVLGGVMSVTSSLGSFLTALVITLFASFFFLLDGRKIIDWLIRMLPAQAHDRGHQAAVIGWQALVGYVRMQIVVAVANGAGIAIGAAILSVPLVIPLGILVFLGSFIPIVGAIITGIVAVLVAFLANGWSTALIMLGIVVLVHQAESNALQPFLMGGKLTIHPLGIILAVTAGSFLLGIAGALFAVPLVAVANATIPTLANRHPTQAPSRDAP